MDANRGSEEVRITKDLSTSNKLFYFPHHRNEMYLKVSADTFLKSHLFIFKTFCALR